MTSTLTPALADRFIAGDVYVDEELSDARRVVLSDASGEQLAFLPRSVLPALPTLTLEDGTVASPGDWIYNYYDRFPVRLGRIGPDGWADTRREDGTPGPMLNGERLCSLEFAASKGWPA